MKKYKVYKNYAYAEIYIVEANSEKEAQDVVDKSGIEPDEIFQDFDFYITEEY